MIAHSDLQAIKDAINKNVPPEERATANAVFNIVVHFISDLSSIASSFDRIATAQEEIAYKTFDHTKNQTKTSKP